MSTKKLNKEELYKLPAIEIYKLVLEGKVLKKFPNGFWQQSEAMDNAVVIIKYLIEDYLKLSDEELKEQLSANLFIDNGLRGMLKALNDSPYDAINLSYPNKFKAWEFKVVPQGFWDDEKNIIKATKWLIEDKLKLSNDELYTINTKAFKTNGLGGLLSKFFNGSPKKAIQEYLEYYNI